VEEARALLAVFRKDLGQELLACAGACATPDWEPRLREEYLARYGPSVLSLPELLESSRLLMALKLSPRSMDEGFREAATELFNDPLFLSGLTLSVLVYMAAWVAPEPLFSKAFAATLTVILAATFGVVEVRNVAMAVVRLYADAEQARSLLELEAVAERFGRALGGTGLRILVMVASHGVARSLPRVPPGWLSTVAGAPRYALPEGFTLTATATAQVAADGTLLVTGAALGTTAAATRAESPCGDGSQKDGSQWHHIATDKNEISTARGGPWTPRFNDYFARVGLGLDAPENRIYLKGHQGPHPEAYHAEVFRRLDGRHGGLWHSCSVQAEADGGTPAARRGNMYPWVTTPSVADEIRRLSHEQKPCPDTST
jgi:hypothetical protein